LATSYVNLINPGTFDLTLPGGKVAPVLDANGWTFDGTTAQMMLSLSMSITEGTCFIARVLTAGAGGGGNGRLLGSASSNRVIIPNNGSASAWINTNTLSKAQITTAKVIAQDGKEVYIDGLSVGTHNAGALTDTVVYIGNQSAGSRTMQGSIQSLAVATSLTAPQMATLKAAMDAVPYP
jgi:hypothetical protein